MTDRAEDRELRAAIDPATDPQLLSELASRRWDLHAVIAAHPRAFPELQRWIAEVNPASAPVSNHPAPPVPEHGGYPQRPAPPPMPAHPQPPPGARSPRRGGLGWWLGGCGCLAFVVVFFLILAFAGGAIASLNGSDGSREAPGDSSEASGAAEHLAAFDAERERYTELAAELEGNPVAPLVTEMRLFRLLEARAEKARTSESEAFAAIEAEQVAQEAREFRETLEQRIADAEARRANSSGSLAEGLVDSAGAGFIDITWNAATQCSPSEKEGKTTAGCVSEEPLAVHLLPKEQALGGDWAENMTTVHELAHLYQRAESDLSGAHESSPSMQLIEQGLFQGSSEKMADCYALTYFDEWTLETDEVVLGYGYVCDEAERQAIREWAASIGAPLP